MDPNTALGLTLITAGGQTEKVKNRIDKMRF